MSHLLCVVIRRWCHTCSVLWLAVRRWCHTCSVLWLAVRRWCHACSVLWLAVRRWCHTFMCTRSINSGSSWVDRESWWSASWYQQSQIGVVWFCQLKTYPITLNLFIYHHGTGQERKKENSEYVNPEMRETPGFPFRMGGLSNPRKQSSQARFWKRGNVDSESLTMFLPEFISVSSPFYSVSSV